MKSIMILQLEGAFPEHLDELGNPHEFTKHIPVNSRQH